jgi:ABC-type glycerol-3-phosphate transport system permease component
MSRAAHGLRVLALVLGALVMAYPFVWMIATSFKSLGDAVAPGFGLWPRTWQPGNFAEVFATAPFARYFWNTLVVATVVTAGVCMTSLIAGYAFARLRFPGRGLLFGLVLATMMVPFEAALVPNYVLITKLGWYNTYAALIVPWCANAFSIFLMRQAFLGIPQDLYDAATIDGCGHLRFLFRIAAPLTRPMLATVAIFAFLGSYNSLLWPLVVTAEASMRVVQVGLTYFVSDSGARVHLLMAAATIVMLPAVALYFAAQRLFTEAAAGAGLKG